MNNDVCGRVVLLAIMIILCCTNVAAEATVPGDLDGDKIVSETELCTAILTYLDGSSEHILPDELRAAAHIHRYYPKRIIDSAGSEIIIYRPIERIVTLTSDQTEVLRSIGASDRIICVNKYVKDDPTFFPEFSTFTSAGTTFDPDLEVILLTNPDIVFTTTYPKPEKLEDKLTGTGIVVARFLFYKPSMMEEELKKIGYLLDAQNEAQKLIDHYNNATDPIEKRVSEIDTDQKVQVYFEWCSDYKVCGSDIGSGEVCAIAGGDNIAARLGTGVPKVDPEWIIEENPDMIVKLVTDSVASCSYDEDDPAMMAAFRDSLMNRPGWGDLSAVEDGRVHLIAYDICPSPSYHVGTAYMAKWLYPELFEDLDPQLIHQEYLSGFQGLKYNLSEHGVFVYPEGDR